MDKPTTLLISVAISIHAPVKGATAHSHAHLPAHQDFNPRTREGCDPPGPDRPGVSGHISIHAPVKGATRRGYGTGGYH